MSESSGVPKAFLEWLNAKKSVSTPPIEMPKNELETETITATTVQLETVPEARIQREIAQTQVAHTLIMESVRIDFPLKPSWRRKEINKRFERSQAEIVDSDNPDFGQKDKEPFKKRKREDISKQRKRVKRESHVSLDDDFQPNQLLNKLAKTDIENLSLSDTGIKKQETMPTLSSETGIPQIYVGSRTHKQLSQLISELKRNTQFKPKMTVLGSREQFCIHPKVSKSPNKNDDCVSLLDSNSCSYFHRTRKLVSLPEFDSEDRVWDIEDMVRLGKSTGGCPYYASRNFFETAEIVFCPYNYILDPVIRKIVNINLENSIVILDEAHNMEDAARSAGSFELDDKSLSMLKIELSQIIKNGYEIHAHGILEHLFNIIWEWITSPENFYEIKEYERHIHVWSSQKIVEKLEELNITGYIYQTQFVPAYTTAVAHADLVRKENEKDASESRHKTVPNDNGEGVVIHKRKCLSNSCLNTIQGVFMIFGNLFREDCNYNDDYRMVAMKRIDKSGGMLRAKKGKGKTKSKVDSTWLYKLGFWCLNPGVIFQDMCKKTKSVILTSGTLSPMASFATELDTQFAASLEANHVIDPSQVWVSCLPVGPNGTSLKGIYSNIESLQYQDDVGEAICQISDKIPYGVLCFLPSYNAMDKLLERWDLTGIKDRMEVKKLVFSEPKGSDKKVFEKMIKKFYDQIDKAVNRPTEEKGAIFFAVYRGKVSEGIDFTNEYCRAVIALGIPYPGM
ncbi:hypothetical protein BY458DRAFT_536907 [Sporodiniella umbellata]|nr:hypothetical protein BY458DRAFT_536907 [Sporodiniella umbellata]